MSFWLSIARALEQIVSTKPDTFDGVKAILDEHGDPEQSGTPGPDSAFFGGSGGDATLAGALMAAGWEWSWAEASYHYVMRHPATGEALTYIEGDVERGDKRPS